MVAVGESRQGRTGQGAGEERSGKVVAVVTSRGTTGCPIGKEVHESQDRVGQVRKNKNALQLNQERVG